MFTKKYFNIYYIFYKKKLNKTQKNVSRYLNFFNNSLFLNCIIIQKLKF